MIFWLLAAIDGRDNNAITKIKNAIDKGGRRQACLEHPVFDHLKNDPRFQAQVSAWQT